MSNLTTTREFFETKYQQSADPWNFAQSDYEQSRYTAILDALRLRNSEVPGHRHYDRAFEPGCSIGALTSRLADICNHVEAIDISPTAVAQAQHRCAALPNVHITCATLADALPEPGLDLVVFSEIGYYFTDPQLQFFSRQLIRCIVRGGTFLAAHWLGRSKDHILSGDRVHEILRSIDGLHLEHSERHEHFRLDRWCVQGATA